MILFTLRVDILFAFRIDLRFGRYLNRRFVLLRIVVLLRRIERELSRRTTTRFLLPHILVQERIFCGRLRLRLLRLFSSMLIFCKILL